MFRRDPAFGLLALQLTLPPVVIAPNLSAASGNAN